MNKDEMHDLWGAEDTENKEISEEKRRVIQEVMHDDTFSEELT